MADEKNKIIVDVEISGSNAVKSLADIRKNIENLRIAQKNLDTTTDDGRKSYVAMEQEIKALNAESQKYTKAIQNEIKEQTALGGSLDQLKANLSNLVAEYNTLSEADRKGAIGIDLVKSINATKDTLKQAENAIQDYSRSIGDYENSIKKALSTGNPFIDNLLNIATSGKGAKGVLDTMKTSVLNLGKALKSLLANPVVLVFSLAVAAVMLLVNAFKRNEENANKLNVVIGKLGSIFTKLMKVLEPIASFVADVLVAAFDVLAKKVEQVMSGIATVLDFLGFDNAAQGVRDFTNEVSESSEAVGNLIKAEQDLEKAQRDLRKTQLEYEKTQEDLRQLRDDESKSISERIKANEELGASINAQLNEELDLANQALFIAKQRVDIYGETKENLDALTAAETNIAEISNRLNKQESEQLRNLNTLRKQSADKAFENENKRLDAKKKTDESILQAEADFQKEDFAMQQIYTKKLFDIDDKYQRDKLANQLKYGKITQDQYNKELTALNNAYTSFARQQAKELNTFLKSQQDSIIALLGDSTQFQIDNLKAEYAKAIKDLEALEPPTPEGLTDEEYQLQLEQYERLVYDMGETKLLLEKELNKQVEQLNRDSLQKQADDIERIISAANQSELDKYADNERKKLEIQIESLKEQIRLKKAAGLDTYADEAALRTAESSLLRKNLSFDLMQQNITAQQRYNLKVAELKAERELYADNADKLKEIDNEILEAYKELQDSKLEAFQQYSSGVLNVASSYNELMNQLGSNEMQRYEEDNEKKKELLKQQLDNGLISQKKYDEEVAKSDKELANKKAQIERENAVRAKALNTFQIMIDTFAAIQAAWKNTATAPFTIPLIVASGAAQLAAIAATPIPKAARGRYITGASHAAGGELIEAEGGEVVINKKSSSMFLPLLSYINEAGGGVPFTKAYADGGYVARSVSSREQTMTYNDLQTALTQAVQSVQVIATIEDIRRGENIYTNIESYRKN